MGKSEKQMEKEQERNQRIIDTAFRLFVEKKIEAVSMDEVAKEAGVGRATLFRCYNNKTELAIAVCASKWKAYLDKLDETRPISSIHDIPEEQFMRVTVHTMMAACTHYAGGFIWGATDNKDYTGDLLLLKEMILSYAQNGTNL